MKKKLRNKKTEEIVDVYNIYISKRVDDDSLTSHENVIRSFDSIAELNEEWEDYRPDEPLIKDEKIRKAEEKECVEVEITAREYDHAEAIKRATENLCGEEEE